MKVDSKPCPFCSTVTPVEVDEGHYRRWQEDRATGGRYRHIQNAMPELSADERELLISGTCSKCWERVFGGQDDE